MTPTISDTVTDHLTHIINGKATLVATIIQKYFLIKFKCGKYRFFFFFMILIGVLNILQTYLKF